MAAALGVYVVLNWFARKSKVENKDDEQQQKTSSTSVVPKAVIVVVLILAAGAALYIKNKPSTSVTNAAGQSTELQSTTGLPRLVDLGATKCVPCKMMAPILEALKTTYPGKLDVVFIDTWEKPDEAKKYNINLIPTQIFFDATGKERFRHEGFFAKEDILAKWKELGVDLPIPAPAK
jgi:thioredoxin 1